MCSLYCCVEIVLSSVLVHENEGVSLSLAPCQYKLFNDDMRNKRFPEMHTH